jgi:hypothetical protein
MAAYVPVEVILDADVDGVYETVIPAGRIQRIAGQFGFKGVGTYVADNARTTVEVVNGDGAYTAPAGLRAGVWAKVRVSGTHELLFTGRIEEIAAYYAAEQPYVSISLSTMRGDLFVPTESALLKNTTTKAAVEALLAEVPLASAGGYWMLGYAALGVNTKLYGSGAATGGGLPVNAYARFTGTGWKPLVAAGGYGVAGGGDLDVLGALAELMKAEAGRAVWGRDNVLEVYAQGWLDAARAGAPARTFTDAEIVSASGQNGAQYANDVRLTWYPKRWEAGVTLWTLDPASPVNFGVNEQRDWAVRFKHGEADRVVAAEQVAVTLSASDGGLFWEWVGEVKATGGTLRVRNYAAYAIDLTNIAIAGTALLSNDQVEARKRAEYDISRYGLRSRTLDCALIDDQATANARAARELAAASVSENRIERIELRARTTADAIAWMTIPFGTRVRITSARLAHDGGYLVIGCDWSASEGHRLIDVTLYLEPVEAA